MQVRAEQIKIGDVFDETSRLGPLINKQQYDKVMGYIQVTAPGFRVSSARPSGCTLAVLSLCCFAACHHPETDAGQGGIECAAGRLVRVCCSVSRIEVLHSRNT